jgi:adenylate cyclase
MTDSKFSFDGLRRLGGAQGALALVAVVLLLMSADFGVERWMRGQLFDGYQQLLPRPRVSAPAVVVAIDERSLAAHGQWPWPRSRLAELIGKVAETDPAAIGVDLLLAEPDRLSPRRIFEGTTAADAALARHVRSLPDNDALLAAAMKGRPVVLAIAGDDAAPPPERPIRAAPVLLRGEPAGVRSIHVYSGVVRGLPELEAAAAGQGLINSGPEGAVIRRVALLGRVGDLILPNLETEMLRVAAGQAMLEAEVDVDGVRTLRVAGLALPTDDDGAVWLRYGLRDPSRVISAADVLAGTVDRALLERKLVLVGLTGLGLVDQPPTPMDERVPGVEIRMQLLENIFDRSWLQRPKWTPWLEAALFVALALLFIVRVPGATPVQAFVAFGAVLVGVGLAGLIAFNFGALVDVALPLTGATLVFAWVLGASLAETQRQRRELTARLQLEREAAARLAGELETARRVQVGMLPESPGILADDPRIDLKAFMEPARSVGGDLYDFFLLDARTLLVMIGDVSGKGLAAAMFMALIKSLCKSAILRMPHALEQAMAQAESEIRRENPESLFVTMMILSLDLDTGEFTFCNAGHDPLYGLPPGQATPRKIDHGGRPPLCVLDNYPYPLGRDRLAPGETLCMITDGITEAADRTGQLYGHKRFETLFARVGQAAPAVVVETLRKDVLDFVAGAEQADDMSVVCLRWNGPAASGS